MPAYVLTQNIFCIILIPRKKLKRSRNITGGNFKQMMRLPEDSAFRSSCFLSHNPILGRHNQVLTSSLHLPFLQHLLLKSKIYLNLISIII